MYSLHYIRGISRYDTPMFAGYVAQKNFFDSNARATFDETYPPYFTNTIKIMLSDYNLFLNKCNYLRLLYENRYYYYFIDNINFISYGVYSIDITMDTIQTFMFDIQFNYINVTRQSIKRWLPNGKINRDYIRENLSIATTYKKDITYESLNTNNNWLLIEAVEGLINTEDVPTIIYSEKLTTTNGTYLYLIPYPKINKEDLDTYYVMYLNDTDTNTGDFKPKTFAKTISDLMRSPKILNISFCNLDSTDLSYTIEYVTTGDYYKINVVDTQQLEITPVALGTVSDTIPSLFLGIANNLKYEYIHNFNFKQNIKLKQMFDYKFVPQLIDENYIDFRFGERLGYTVFPLCKRTDTTITLYAEYDLLSTERIYKIQTDEFFTNIVNKTKQNLRLYNNAWQNYIATNKGTLTTGIDLAVNNNMFKTIKGLVSGGISGIGGALINPIGGATGGILGLGNVGADHFIGLYNIEQNLKITKENLEFTPDTARQGNTFTSDIANKSLEVFKYIAFVDDIEDVARKLENFGYKVDKVYYNVQLSYNTVFNNRQYFDIIKGDDMSITLVNYSDNETIITAIKERIQAGLRMWHQYNNNDLLVNLQYDNVEKE